MGTCRTEYNKRSNIHVITEFQKVKRKRVGQKSIEIMAEKFPNMAQDKPTELSRMDPT